VSVYGAQAGMIYLYLRGVRVFTRGSCIYKGFVYCSLFVGCTCNQAKQGVGLEHRYLHRKGMLGLVSSVGSFCHTMFHCDIRPLTVQLGWFGTCSIAICETERLATGYRVVATHLVRPLQGHFRVVCRWRPFYNETTCSTVAVPAVIVFGGCLTPTTAHGHGPRLSTWYPVHKGGSGD
jgi:hypothetical protein